MSNGSENSPVDVLVEDFLERRQRGERASVEEYCQRHPELADEIRDVFEAVLMVEDLKPGSQDASGTFGDNAFVGQRLDSVGDYRILREIGRGGMGVVYEAEQQSLGRRVAVKVLPQQMAGHGKSRIRFYREAQAAARLHHTNIVPVFDVGSDGELVYYAMQLIQGQGLDLVIDDLVELRSSMSVSSSRWPSPRSVPPSQPAAPRSIAKSLVSGSFQPPRLNEDAEAGSDRVPPSAKSPKGPSSAEDTETVAFEGSSVSAVLPGNSEISTAENNRRAYFRSVAQIGVQTANALSYAHTRGIIHRDIKPANLLLDAAGVVWVTDFGLAKTGDSAVTHTGDILGTIRYMSPERFKGQCDVRADVYSLGLTLYELLTLKPAFGSADQMSLIEAISRSDPPAPRAVDPRVPRDFETIVLKAIDKDPKRRYQSADELEADLQRFIDDEPIRARRVSLVERFARWSRRNKALAGTLALLAALVTTLAVVASFTAAHFQRMNASLNTTLKRLTVEKDRADRTALENERLAEARERQAAAAVAAKQETLRNLYFAHINIAQAALASGEVARQQELLGQWRPADDGTPDLRSFEWYYLLSQGTDEHRILLAHNAQVRSVAWSPNGQRIASAGNDHIIRIWEARSGQLLKTIAGHDEAVVAVAWGPEGRRLASASADAMLKIWDPESGEEVSSATFDSQLHHLQWSPDGARLALADRQGVVRVWDVELEAHLAEYTREQRGGTYVAWHPDSRRIAIAGGGPAIEIWDCSTDELVATYQGNAQGVRTLSWHADGERLATAGGEGEVFVWQLGSRRPLRRFGAHGAHAVHAVAWSPGGPGGEDLLMTAGGDQSLCVWEMTSGRELHRFRGHESAVTCGSWSPDGKQLVTGSADNTVRLWAAPTQNANALPGEHQANVQALAWSADGAFLATGDDAHTIRLWSGSSKELLHVLVDPEVPQESVRSVAFSPNGRLLASGGADGFVRLWDVKTGALAHRFEQKHGAQANNPQYRGVNEVVWSPDGKRLVSAGEDPRIRVWDVANRQLLDEGPANSGSSTYTVRFSPDGKYLLTGQWINQPIQIWDARSWKKVGSFSSGGIMVRSLRFSPDGRRLAAGGGLFAGNKKIDDSDRGQILIWDWEELLENPESPPTVEILNQPKVVWRLTWSADGHRLTSASNGGTAQLWDVNAANTRVSGRELMTFGSPDAPVRDLAFSPGGSRLALATRNTVEFCDAYPGYVMERSAQLLPTLDARIAAGNASPEDYRLRGDIDALQGHWDAAAVNYERYLQSKPDTPWLVPAVWIAGYFPGELERPFWPEAQLTTGFDPTAKPETAKPETAKPETAKPETAKPETAAAVSRWRRLDSRLGDPINFGRLLGRQPRRAAYATYQVYSPRRQEAAILLGDDDFHCLWFNGKKVSSQASVGDASPDEFAVGVTLQRGWNTLLVKVVNADDRPEASHGLFLTMDNDPEKLAAVYESKGRYDEAVRLWDQALALRPGDRSLLLNRAAARWRLEDREGANADFAAFIRGHEDNAEAVERRARVYLQLARVAEGQAEYDRAVAADPQSPGLRKRIADSKMFWGRPAEAIPHLEFLIARFPDQPGHYLAAMLAQVECGNAEGFGQLRTKLLERWGDEDDPQLATPAASVALAFPADEGELETVLAMAQSAAQAGKGWGTHLALGVAHYRRGVLLESQGKKAEAHAAFDVARRSLERAAAETPKQWQAVRIAAGFALAAVLDQLDDKPGALQTLERYETEHAQLDESGNGQKYYARVWRSEARRLVFGPAFRHLETAKERISSGRVAEALDSVAAALSASSESEIVLKQARVLLDTHMVDHRALSPTAETGQVLWQYRFTPASANWNSVFEPAAEQWRAGPAPFRDAQGAGVSWDKSAPDIWVRREFQWDGMPGDALLVRANVDDQASVYVNGILAAQIDTWTGNAYVVVPCRAEAAAALRPGKNLLAVHCHNSQGRSGLDVGLFVAGERDAWGGVLDHALQRAPDSNTLLQARSLQYLRSEQYREASEAHRRSSDPDASVECLRTAALLALAGDRQAYQDYCRQLLDKHLDANPFAAEQLVKACLAMPDAVDPARLPQHKVIAEWERPAHPLWWTKWACSTMALAALRTDDLQKSRHWLNQVDREIASNPEGHPELRALAAAIKALLHLRLQADPSGAELSRNALNAGREALRQAGVMRRADGTLVGSSLLDSSDQLRHNALIAECLLREAETLLRPARNAGRDSRPDEPVGAASPGELPHRPDR